MEPLCLWGEYIRPLGENFFALFLAPSKKVCYNAGKVFDPLTL